MTKVYVVLGVVSYEGASEEPVGVFTSRPAAQRVVDVFESNGGRKIKKLQYSSWWHYDRLIIAEVELDRMPDEVEALGASRAEKP